MSFKFWHSRRNRNEVSERMHVQARVCSPTGLLGHSCSLQTCLTSNQITSTPHANALSRTQIQRIIICSSRFCEIMAYKKNWIESSMFSGNLGNLAKAYNIRSRIRNPQNRNQTMFRESIHELTRSGPANPGMGIYSVYASEAQPPCIRQ
jgi:hypothetical protein